MDDSQGEGWWQRHGLTVFILFTAALTAFLIRTLWSYSLIAQCNITYCFAGGSDSFYHARVMTWIIQNHSNLITDPLLNYPLGLINPREPLFDWMNALLGIVFAPLFGGNAVNAGQWFLEMQPPFWAAAGVVPVYLLGREVSSRRMGLLAAILYPLFVASIESTVATYANYLSFYAFFVFLTLTVYLHSVKLSGTRRWVESYRSPRAIWNGAKNFVRVERNSMNWTVFTGVALGATMLAWQGYTYVIAVIVIFMVITILVERIRRVDSFGIYVVTLLSTTIAFFMAMPYYYVQGEFGYWFTLPMIIFYGAMLALLPFIMMRDTPWLFSLGVMAASIGAAAYGLFLYSPADFNAVITGQGYFVKTLIYSTVAEAQAPSFDTLIVSYGPVTFFLAFIGVGVFIFYLYKYKFRREHTFMVILGILGIYLPLSAAKFFLIGTPLFALLPAELILFALDRMGYAEMRHTYSTLSQSGGTFFALRKSLKARHFVIVVIALAIVLPNVWYAVDAGIPYNDKTQYDTQIYNSLPPGLRVNASQSSSFYLGAAGVETDTPNQYDEAGYDWLASQDTGLPPGERPAVIGWWDYGFQVLDEGDHPAVADNFQDGIVPSGHFLMAQNESQAIAVLATDLLYAVQLQDHKEYLPTNLNEELRAAGLNLSTLHNYMANTTQDEYRVINNPQLYGPVNAANIEGTGGALNALYYTVAKYISSALNENGVVDVYQILQDYTGYSIGYGIADTREFPTSGSNTGIYYAPVDLIDGVISAGGIPTYYFTVNATGSDGNTYPLGSVPPGVQTVSTSITYNAPFYNSMLYRTFIGYNGTDIGAGTGIPGVSSSLTDYPVEPGWMMQHFFMAYRTAYYCPSKNYSSNPNCFGAVSYQQALADEKANTGTVDISSQSYVSGGQAFLEYYPGATITGYVDLSNGQPISNVNVTILDQWGIPHMVTKTNKYGAYTLTAPPGNDSIVVSEGPVSGLEQVGSTQITTVNVTVSKGLAMTYDGPQIFVPIKLQPGSLNGRVYWNVGHGSFNPSIDTLIPGAKLTLSNGVNYNVTTAADLTGTYLFSSIPPGDYDFSVSLAPGSSFSLGTLNFTSGETKTVDEGINVTRIGGTVVSVSGTPVPNAFVSLYSTGQPTRSYITGSDGQYNFTQLTPANYSIRASATGGLTSPPQVIGLFSKGQNVSLNLTVSTPATVSIELTYNGFPVPNVPIRFSPLEGAGNVSVVYYTDSKGVATEPLNTGIWSVYALGALNGTWVSTLFDLELGNGTITYQGTYGLSEAATLKGIVYATASKTPQNGANIVIEATTGAVMEASTNATGWYNLLLPQGSYTLLATYAASGSTPTDAAVGTAAVYGVTTMDMTLLPALRLTPTVGYTSYTGSFVGVAGATVSVAFNGNVVSGVSGPSGNVNITLPQMNTTFTVSTSRYGFQSTPLTFTSAPAISQLKQIVVKTVPIPVAFDVSCPGCVSAPQVNFSAVSPPANSTTVTATSLNGTYQVTADLSPGPYSITSSSNFEGELWENVGTEAVTVPIGSPPIALPRLSLLRQESYVGNISLLNVSRTAVISNATVHLASPDIGSFNISGPSFTNSSSPFHAPPGNYTLWIVAQNGTKDYSFLGNVTLGVNGGAVTPIKLSQATTLSVDFTNSYGSTQNAPIDVRVASAGGASYGAALNFVSGAYSTLSEILPNGTYAISVNSTALLNVSGIQAYVTFATKPTPNYCTFNFTETNCNIVLNATSARTLLNATAYIGTTRLPVTGTVLLLPKGGNATSEFTEPIVNGLLSALLLPGEYSVYATTDMSGVPEVSVTTLSVPFNRSGVSLALHMSPGWLTSTTLTPPSGISLVGTGDLNVSSQNGSETFYMSGLSFNSPHTVILPSGSWTLTGFGTAYPYTKSLTLTATQNITISGGNAAVDLQLFPLWSKTASISISGATSVSAAENSTVSFAFTVKDTGNAPEYLSFKGAPVTWNFTFYPASVTLSPSGQDIASVDVNVHITNGTLVTQGQATFEALLNNTQTPAATATVTVNVDPIHQIRLAYKPSGDVVGNHTITIAFTVAATGNTVENVNASVLNGAYLEQNGWIYDLSGTFSGLTPGNPATTGTLTLNAKIAGAVVPGNVTIIAIDTSDPEANAQLTITVPSGTITVPGPLVVTGPSVGSASAWYIVYVQDILTVAPAVAIVTFAVGRRWWKNRRWVRR